MEIFNCLFVGDLIESAIELTDRPKVLWRFGDNYFVGLRSNLID